MSLDGPDKGEMGLPAVTGLRIVLSTSPNKSGRGVVVALMSDGTTTSGTSTPPVGLQVFLRQFQSSPNLLHRDLCSVAGIHCQRLLYCPCQYAGSVPVVIQMAAVIRYFVN